MSQFRRRQFLLAAAALASLSLPAIEQQDLRARRIGYFTLITWGKKIICLLRPVALCLALVAALPTIAPAQGWPQKPVRVVVPNTAGSLSDTLSRTVFSKVSEVLGQQFFIDDRPGVGLAQPHVQSGKVVALAVIGPRLPDVLPGVPSLSSFYPEAEVVNWHAAYVPAGTPRPVVDRLNATLVRVLESPEMKTRLAQVGLTASSGTPAELDEVVRADQAVHRELIKRIGLKLD